MRAFPTFEKGGPGGILENQFYLMVYKLYGLNHAEVKIVDPEFAMSEEEYNRLHFGFQEELATSS